MSSFCLVYVYHLLGRLSNQSTFQRKSSLPSLLVNIFSNSLPPLENRRSILLHNMVFSHIHNSTQALRINTHRHLFYKIRILVFTDDEYNIHGVIFSWVRRNSGVNICHSSSFTIFRFFRGGKPFQCHKLPTLQRQNSGLSRGVKIASFPFLSFSSYVSV